MKPTLDELTDQGYEEVTNGFYVILKKKNRIIIYDFKSDKVIDTYKRGLLFSHRRRHPSFLCVYKTV